ncbi:MULTISPECIES: hypothetical protein [unclassified Saccharicrinis]|uniref:hypothetical protein n=1 Tax=unclassified Saccharicrinis TaxID=2646859 RepID=UPI003D35555A
MKLYIRHLLFLLVILAGCNRSSFIQVKPTNPELDYVGRINFENPDSVEMYWSGSSVSMNFKGTSVSATLHDENGLNYFNIVVDGQPEFPLKLDKGEKTYLLADSLALDTEHSISLIKRNEWHTGSTQFAGYTIVNGEVLKASEKNGRLIEFFGNSITAGYAIENNTGGDSPDSTFTNNYKSYAAITARHFKADLHCTVRSGIGIQVSWHGVIMPEIYNRLNPADATSLWDFTQKVPDIVVINLMQNDSWLVNLPDHEAFKYRFGDQKPSEEKIISSYADFVSKIRTAYPKSYIICALGSMDATRAGSPWPGYVKSAVDALEDDKILTHFFPYINKNGHPRVDDNKNMAASLIAFIEKNTDW